MGLHAGDSLRLTPADLLAKAAVNNLDLEVQMLERQMSEDREIIAGEDMVPVFFVDTGFDSSDRRLNQREFLGAGQIREFREDRLNISTGVEGMMEAGTRYQLRTGTSRIKNSSNAAATAPFRPEYQSVTTLSVTQPLLQGRGREVTLAPQRVQRTETMAVTWENRGVFEQVAARILSASWENHFAWENIRVKEEALELAQTLLQENRRRVEEGMMADIDVTQAEVRVAEAREELIEARALYRQRQNMLWDLTHREPRLDRTPIEVVGLETALPEPVLERMDLVQTMRTRNPIYQSQLARAEGEDVRLLFAENLALPQLDLTGSLGYNGLEETFGESIRDYGDRDRPDWGLGLSLRMPLDRSVDQARVREARAGKRQALLQIRRTEMELYTVLENLLHDIEDARERVGLVNESVRLAEEALRGEQRRLDSGLTTTYNVLNQQRELSLVRTRALSAEVALQRTLIDVHLLQGILSEKMGFTFTP